MGGSRKLAAVALAVIALLVVAPASPGATYAVKAGKSSSGKWVWKPSFRHIVKGNRIRWKNPTSKAHTVSAYGGGWSKHIKLAPGDATAKRFRKPGLYRYRCKIHSSIASDGSCNGMCGSVHVSKS